MDHRLSKPDTDSWVDERMANLDPSAEWKPDADLALDRLTRRKPALNAPWMRLAMTSTILAATVVVLVLLPWQRLWTPKPATTVAAKTQTSPAEKPAEKAQETPAPEAPPKPTPQEVQGDASPKLRDALRNLEVVSRDSNELVKALGLTPQIKARIETSQANSSEPVPINTVLPEYSDEGRQARIQGTIEMVVTVKTDGTVQFESFKKTLGHGLDEKAREAVEKWLFTPAKKDGNPVSTTITISTNFSLR